MNQEVHRDDKELYRKLRQLPWNALWNEEAKRFDAAPASQRTSLVGVIRAVGVVFSESGNPGQKAEVKEWLFRLLQDPSEKVRRYAIAAIPKTGPDPRNEPELLSLLRRTTCEREREFLAKALAKIGGAPTLEILAQKPALLPRLEQKIKAAVARTGAPTAVRLDRTLGDFAGLRILLRVRRGLESILRDEVRDSNRRGAKFRATDMGSGWVATTPLVPFTLGDLYSFRCFDTFGFVLGGFRSSTDRSTEELAGIIASPASLGLLETFTEGSIRYRLNFIGKGHQRGLVRQIADRAFALRPEVLNDPREAPWTVNIYPSSRGHSVELSPHLRDPRSYYRTDDVPAASHRPLAACMARLAGRMHHEIVWDPFCGSGLELIESAILGGVMALHGTDCSGEAIRIARENLAAANLQNVPASFAATDFRADAALAALAGKSISLIITNPPMGKRVPVPNLHGLIDDLLEMAGKVLRPGGRLVFVNPMRKQTSHPALRREHQQTIDLGGFSGRLEKYVKQAP